VKPLIQLHPDDNVAIALTTIEQGREYQLDALTIVPKVTIDKGHKIAIKEISSGGMVTKYGAAIGTAQSDIGVGEWVHTHILKTNLNDEVEYVYEPKFSEAGKLPDDSPQIEIYRREDGQVAIRNELWLIPTVGCVNGMAQHMVKLFLQKYPDLEIDGVHVFPHQFGCSQLGDDLATTRVLFQNMVRHPNAGGVLVVGLGCENNQISGMQEGLQDCNQDRVRYLVTQQVEDEVEAGLKLMDELYQVMKNDKREAGRLSEINFGLECGGSDGLSGITANPLLGLFSDYLIARGGTTVLTEVPEMFGAETLLMERCKDEQTFEKLVAMVNGFKRYYKDHDQPIYENPSPGNKKGGISTLEDKSLGCTQKAGRSVVEEVLDYGARISSRGLHLLNAPGNDAIATSALGACGCHMVLFTTGRGTPYGGFVPTMKIATNSDLANRKKHWIDFNAGVLVEDANMEEVLMQFIRSVANHCSGVPTKNEQNEFREVAVWKKGVVL
jgi:altronate hydrolase